MSGSTAGRRSGPFRFAIALALVALLGGGVFAYLQYQRTAGPDGAVRAYFAALARSDAPAALGFGDVPAGGTALLTSTVLREQQKIAPLRSVHVISVHRDGPRATVTVQYRLLFANGIQQISDTVRVVRRDGSWRLAATAMLSRLRLLQASGRATVVGAPVPTEPVLLFPGAVPLRFDTPYLELTPATSAIELSGGAQTALDVEVTTAGRAAMNGAISAALRSCLTGAHGADPRCPLPDARAVPGTLRATVTGRLEQRTRLTVAPDSHGIIQVSGTAQATGSYTALDFDNLPVAKRGPVTLPMRASAFAVTPLVIRWADST